MKPKTIILIILLVLVVLLNAGCNGPAAQSYAAAGSIIGAITGQIVGQDTESTLGGAGIGGVIGYIFGNERDKKVAADEREELRQQVRECCPQQIVVRFSNSDGTPNMARLTRHGSGYIGEFGEYYYRMPACIELKRSYGY